MEHLATSAEIRQCATANNKTPQLHAETLLFIGFRIIKELQILNHTLQSIAAVHQAANAEDD